MKNMQKIFAAVCFIAMAAISFTGCVDQDFDQPEVKVIKFEGKANKTIAEIRAMHEKGKIEQFSNEDVITGYVVSSDTDGNFYKSIVIQDAAENPTAGIEVKINEKGLSAVYPVGQQVFIKLKDLYMGDYNGLIQIGGGTYKKGNYINLSGIESAMMDSHIFVNGTPVDVKAKDVTLEELKSNYIVSTLVKINDVQFQNPEGLTYAEKASKESSATNRTIEDAKGNTLTIRNSGYSKFYDVALPTGSGSLTVVLSQFGKTNQGTIRNTADADMTGKRFGEVAPEDIPTPNATIADIKKLYSSALVNLTEDKVFDAVVISNNGKSKNFYNKVIVQDETGGIEIKGFKSAFLDGLTVGQKVVVSTKGMVLDVYNGSTQLGTLYKGKIGGLDDAKAKKHVFKTTGGEAPTPAAVTIKAITDAQINTLVKFDKVQFLDSEKGKTYAKVTLEGKDYKYGESRTFTDAEGNQFILRTSNTATFHADKLPEKSGSIVGIVSKYKTTYQLYIRSTEDVAMTADRFTVSGGDTGGDTGTFTPKTVTELNETFGGVTKYKDITLAGWFSEIIKGKKKWQGKEYSGNKYISVSAYKAKEADLETWIVTPGLDVAKAKNKNFTFESQRHYSKDETLEVLISSDFDYSKGVAAATWKKLNVTLAKKASGHSGFAKVGDIDLSSYSGVVYIAFKYVGNNTTATGTFDIDNVKFNYTAGGDTGGGDTGGGDTGTASNLFAGSDFEDFAAFKAGLNKFGIKSYATQSDAGRNGSKALSIKGTPKKNDYVFTATVPEGFKATGKTKITFYVKGTSAKTLSINIYKKDGKYDKFNLGDYSAEATIEPASSNQYTGTIDTAGKWLKVTLNISGIELADEKGNSLFALKVGKEVAYDLLVDDITIE